MSESINNASVSNVGHSAPVREAPADYTDPALDADSAALLAPPCMGLGHSGLLFEITQLMLRSCQVDRQAARERSNIEEQLIEAAGQRQVHELQQKAEAIWMEGLYSGIGQGLAGLGQIGSAFCSEPVGGETDWGKVWVGGGDASKGLMTPLAADRKQAQADRDASITQANTQEAGAKQRQGRADEDANAARQMQQRLLQIIGELGRIEAASQQAAVRA